MLLLLMMIDDDLSMIQNNAIDILTKCDELRKQFLPLRWEVRSTAMQVLIDNLPRLNTRIRHDSKHAYM